MVTVLNYIKMMHYNYTIKEQQIKTINTIINELSVKDILRPMNFIVEFSKGLFTTVARIMKSPTIQLSRWFS